MIKKIIILLGLSCIALLAGCQSTGSHNDDGHSYATTPTYDRNAECAKLRKQLGAYANSNYIDPTWDENSRIYQLKVAYTAHGCDK